MWKKSEPRITTAPHAEYFCSMFGKIVSLLFICFIPGPHIFAQDYQPTLTNVFDAGITVMTKDLQGKYLIAGDETGNIYFNDLFSGQKQKTIKTHGAPVSILQFNSTGKLLISATHDGEIKIFDFDKDKIIQSIFSPDYSGINFVLFSIADGFIYFNGNNRLYKTRSDLSQHVDLVSNDHDTITDAVITSDRSSLIYSAGSELKVMNTRTDVVRQEFNTGSSAIRKIALVKDTLLATWSDDGVIYFWHYLLGQIDVKPVFFLRAGNPSAMSFSPDGKMMISGNIGNWARLWKPMERKISQELFSHSKTVTSSCFGLTNDYLFTGSSDGSIKLWKKGAPPPPIIKEVAVVQDSVPQVPTENKSVEMTLENIPKFISGRKVISDVKINVNSSDLKIYVYDNSYIDGDTMSLFFNGKWILDHYGVTKQKQEVNLKLTPNTNNFLVLFANNLGKSPPNTAAIEFNDGTTKKIFRLSSDLKTCSAINFFYSK